METVSKIRAKVALAIAGIFALWYLRPSQLDIYELLQKHKDPFVEASRRFGKTTSTAVFVHELLIQNPGWICRWCAPDQKQARTIVKPIFAQIQKDTPEEHRARWKTTDSHYEYPNGSKLYLVGVNHDKGESARGPAANIIVLDEYGFWVEAEYIAKSILYPQLQNQEGQWFIKTSTPPPNLDHPYYREKEVAMRKGRFIQKLIWDNEALTKEELDKIIEEAGGVESDTFKREYLCEKIADPKKIVVPEFSDDCIVDDDYPRPEYCDTYVAIDSGLDDNTAKLYAYYDFKNNEVVVEDESFLNGETTKTIILISKLKEHKLWNFDPSVNYDELFEKIHDDKLTKTEREALEKRIGSLFDNMEKKPFKRVYDSDKQLAFDVIGDHEYPIQRPRKADKTASVHELRTEIQRSRFKIKKRCVNLIYQMKVGMWQNEKRLDFERSDTVGHLDGIAAAMYLQRSIERDRNPWPANHGLHRETHFTTPASSPLGKTTQALQSVFGGKTRRFR